MIQDFVTAQNVWEVAIPRLQARSESVYDQYFACMQALELAGEVLHLGVPDDFFRDVVLDNYGDLLSEALRNINGIDYSFELHDGYTAAPAAPEVKVEAVKEVQKSVAPASTLASKVAASGRGIHTYSFGNFVVGPSNREAFAVAKAVAGEPGNIYNPFFVYGTNGVGKTHLLQAISAEINVLHPELVVRSVTCDGILNDFYDLLLNKRSFTDFRAFLRDVDVLLIDDIHLLSKKTQMQEEFFNIFNLLYRQNKQIVLTSDRQPCQIADLDQRLASRFEQGMTCEVGMLEFEERLVTLRMWRESSLNRCALSDEFLEFLAGNIASNVRRLKGCFLRLSAAVEMSGGREFTIEDAEELLHVQLAEESASREIKPESIQHLVAKHFGVSVPDIIGTRRTRQVAEPRMVAMYLCRELTRLSSNEIGDAFGRTHANVLHAARTIADRCQTDDDMRRAVSQLKKQLQH
ncbi:MAG: chromosomal replication initiator protein DnaA [Lentisphaeria bacterium]|nr:chromosomal replication initiator protein DnaA [Lentisphaeria bacterium]